ncbi:HAMP domain-containing sensor histidine kinase [Dactylosporangium sp. NPDC005555]|uniref:sensor histidine kinase n=1 Tax=Dactylosporangium sp. NPDC005555 TaxID=3154889 RepID=UPI0033B1ACB9
MNRSPDARMVRRATIGIAAQVAAAVAATVLLVSVLAFSLTVRAEHRAEERTVRAVTVAAGPQLTGSDGVVLLRRDASGAVTAGPAVPEPLARLDLMQLRAGRGNARVAGHEYETYAVEQPDGSRTVGLLDVTARTESGERLVGSLLVGGLLGIAAAGAAGVLLGRRAVLPLARALELQRRFVADASHELRTPLAVLHTRAELIQRRIARAGSPADDRLRADLARLTADTHALGEVVEDLLLSAELQHRPAAGVRVDAGDLVRDLVTSVGPHAERRGVALVADTGDEQLTVEGVRSSLRRALAALVDNALAHVDAGGIVTVDVHGGGGRVYIAVTDDGDGLDPAETRNLMRRFARGDGQADREGRRFGIGLALVNEVVDAHRGRLEVSGSPGRGARFVIDLPAAPAGDHPGEGT